MLDLNQHMDRPPSRWPWVLPLLAIPWAAIALAQTQSAYAPLFGSVVLDFVVLGVLLLLSAFFSASESAITTLWPWKIRELAQASGPSSAFALVERDVTRFLTTILVGNNLVNISATVLVTEISLRIFGSAGIGYATAAMTVLVLFFGEITPKNLAVHHAELVAKFVVRPIYVISVLLYPIGKFFSWAAMKVLRLLHLEPAGSTRVTAEELKLMLAGARESGVVPGGGGEVLQNVLSLEDVEAHEIMVPRVEMVAVEAETSLFDFLKLARQTNYSRIPVYQETIDEIVGIAYARDLQEWLDQPEQLKTLSVSEIARPAFFVPEPMSAWSLIRELRRRRAHMAIVVDEFGGTAGLITLEDLIEEILGEIYDETDEEEEDIVKIDHGTFLIQAQAPVDEVAEVLGIELPEGDYETLSGFIYDAMGAIPEVGEALEFGPYRFVVEEADERRILKVRAEPAEGSVAETARSN